MDGLGRPDRIVTPNGANGDGNREGFTEDANADQPVGIHAIDGDC
jgi:hypothetical protein